MQDFVGDLASALTECKDEEFVVECLGILGNLSLPDLDYSQILHKFNLIPWIRNALIPGKFATEFFIIFYTYLIFKFLRSTR